VGVSVPQIAIGTSALAVAVSATFNLFLRARAGLVKWRCGIVFSLAGMVGANSGARLAAYIDGQKLLGLFGVMMLVIGLAMFRQPNALGKPDIRLTFSSAPYLVPWLIGIGFFVGLLSGFFGIGGGFLIVPGLMLATGMPLAFAVGTSFLAIMSFGATTAFTYAITGQVDWSLTGIFIANALLGGIGGHFLGTRIAHRQALLTRLFASLVIVVGLYVVGKAALVWFG
jgi:uncharacterized membrane protein YfcA